MHHDMDGEYKRSHSTAQNDSEFQSFKYPNIIPLPFCTLNIVPCKHNYFR